MSASGSGTTPVLPGGTLGIVGGGQLGRMLAMAARRMGYRVHVLEPTPDAPAGALADAVTLAAYDDVEAVRRFAQGVDVVTLEFENVSSAALEAAAEVAPVRPGPRALYVTQDRGREKRFLRDLGLPHVAYAHVPRAADESAAGAALGAALQQVGPSAVVKTAGFGYDGKGQVLVRDAADVAGARALVTRQDVVVERFVDLAAEISVVVARGADGDVATYPYFVNRHERHILDVTVSPWRVAAGGGVEPTTATDMASRTADSVALPDPDLREPAAELARAVADGLDLVGVACVEFFVTSAGELLVNEIAPRPHNSGHLTIEASLTSQFEQQLRAVCGLPLGATDMVRPAAMANLLGDLWRDGEPNWRAAAAVKGVALHLYGKRAARPGRKMGHVTATASDLDDALAKVLAARAALSSR
ncbi:MAG: 5-(carboxyamino)imidazole ribonucleotide synthase [Trueperaceae bacterium]